MAEECQRKAQGAHGDSKWELCHPALPLPSRSCASPALPLAHRLYLPVPKLLLKCHLLQEPAPKSHLEGLFSSLGFQSSLSVTSLEHSDFLPQAVGTEVHAVPPLLQANPQRKVHTQDTTISLRG